MDSSIEQAAVDITSRDPVTRRAAVRTLAGLHSPTAVRILVAALADHHPGVREEAVRALAGRLADPGVVDSLIGALGADNLTQRVVAAKILARCGAPAVVPLLGALGFGNATVARGVRGVLEWIGDYTVGAGILDALESGDTTAARIIRAWADRDREAIWRVVAAWSKQDAPVDGRLAALVHAPEGWVRCWAAQALGRMGAGRSAPLFLEMLAGGDADDRAAAAIGLGHLGDTRALPGLVAALGHRHRETREAALRALGRLGGLAGAATAHLHAFLREERDAVLRETCRWVLRSIETGLASAPAELEAAAAPAGSGTELEPAPAPSGRGTELQPAEPPPSAAVDTRRIRRRRQRA